MSMHGAERVCHARGHIAHESVVDLDTLGQEFAMDWPQFDLYRDLEVGLEGLEVIAKRVAAHLARHRERRSDCRGLCGPAL